MYFCKPKLDNLSQLIRNPNIHGLVVVVAADGGRNEANALTHGRT